MKLNKGHIACLHGEVGDWVTFLVTQSTESEVAGLVMTSVDVHQPNQLNVLITDSRIKDQGERDLLIEDDQLVWILLPFTVELSTVKGGVQLKKIGEVLPIVMEEVARKTREFVSNTNTRASEAEWHAHEEVESMLRNYTLPNIEAASRA